MIDEINALYKCVQTFREEGNIEMPSKSCPFTFMHTCLIRNKRCVLAYLRYRLEKLVEFRWDSGSVLSEAKKKKLAPDELHYFNKYDSILTDYMRSNDMEITLDMKPPKDLYVQVRVIKECGRMILPESGDVNLELNTNHFLRRSDVEQLVRQGFVVQVSSSASGSGTAL